MLANVPPVVRLQKHIDNLVLECSLTEVFAGAAGARRHQGEPPGSWLAVGVVNMARGIGTTSGISLMALAWHVGSHSYQAGNTGYSGSEQARPAFAVLAVRGRDGRRDRARQPYAGARVSGAAEGGEPVRCGSLRDT
jgi:hypothetical protein